MARQTTHARREPRQAARARLLEAAEHLVDGDKLPFSEISIDRLTREVGMPRTRFYNYFDDKNELLLAWLEQGEVQTAAAARRWCELTAKPTRDELEDILRTMLEVHRRHRAMFGAVSETVMTDPDLSIAFQQIVRVVIDGLREHIMRGQDQGWVDPTLPPHETAAWLVWGWERNAAVYSDSADPTGFEQSLRGFTDFVWSGIYL